MDAQLAASPVDINTLIVGYEKGSKEQYTFKTFVLYFIERSTGNPFWERPLDQQRAILKSFFGWLQTRPTSAVQIRVFNPDPERDGYSAQRTIIEISQADAPYIIDSLHMVLNRLNIESDPLVSLGGIQCARDSNGALSEVYLPDSEQTLDLQVEAPIRIEIAKIYDSAQLEALQQELLTTLNELHKAINDWGILREKCQGIIEELEEYKQKFPSDETREAIAFLKWLLDEHFLFMGYRQYDLIDTEADAYIQAHDGSGCGLLRYENHSAKKRYIRDLPAEAQRLVKSNKVLIITKTNTRSRIHRPDYTDYIGIKQFNSEGKLIGEHRFIGLFSHSAYHDTLKSIPFIRQKVNAVLALSKLPIQGYSGKKLVHIMEDFPRDDLFQIDTDDLYSMVMTVLQWQERKVVRFFARKNAYGRFYSCIIYLPREKATLEFSQKLEKLLSQHFHSSDISSAIHFGSSVTARLHYIVRITADEALNPPPDCEALEQIIIDTCKSWLEKLQESLKKTFELEEASQLFQRYQDCFSLAYHEDYSSEQAVLDIKRLEALTEDSPLAMNLFLNKADGEHHLRCKLFQLHQAIPLSNIIPIFEKMGLEVLEEHPYECQLGPQKTAWICDYYLKVSHYDSSVDFEVLKPLLSELFFAVWTNVAENDSLNALVQLTACPWRLIVVIRAYTRYLKQTALPYSQSCIEEVVLKHHSITHNLLRLFVTRFSLETQTDDSIQLKTQILSALAKVSNLDEDKILRAFLALIEATQRTNFYQTTADGQHKSYLAFKFKSCQVPALPLPYPLFEIFVYAPTFEAIHLRATKVARGGIRWSDRREDFRTEVLGLMKAQQVKNTVIVPGGSKGGFVLKAAIKMNREELQQEAVSCYQNFMRGLLDLTDNLQGNTVIHPPRVKRYDEDDTYLVVAADKGTASFSDYANAVAEEYSYWLGDAFASGGSFGYDHKKIAITARGAWISVEAHFKTLGINPDTTTFTAIGIGDMNGDVFGNGLLRSRKTQLVAAFNHLHIFLDPTPEAEISYRERERLFQLPRSSWADYDLSCISQGGGVFERSAKEIPLSPQVQALLGVNSESLEPNALIQAILLAEVDLLFNGGIGTYVKATSESQLDVGDKANDALRINAKQLRCRIVGEGGNLGFTQRGRIEYAQAGGLIFTDFIDNSAGVDLSDHEVNTKILLSLPVSQTDLTLDDRNALLKAMTDEVAELVLNDNRAQTELLNYSISQAVNEVEVHGRCLGDLERLGKINRDVEFLPSDQVLQERMQHGLGLTAPEIAILLAYVKLDIKQSLLKSTLLDEDYFLPALEQEFPPRLNTSYPIALNQHRLKREITATQLVNQLLTETSIIFVRRLQEETQASVATIVKAYTVVRDVFQVPQLLQWVRDLDYQIPTAAQHSMRTAICRFSRHATRWLLRHQHPKGNILDTVQDWRPITVMTQTLKDALLGLPQQKYQILLNDYLQYGINSNNAAILASVCHYAALLDIHSIATDLSLNGNDVANTYFILGEQWGLAWLREEIASHSIYNYWEALAHSSQRDELDALQAKLTQAFLTQNPSGTTALTNWQEQHKTAFSNWQSLLTNLQKAGKTDYVMHTVALKTLSDVIAQLS